MESKDIELIKVLDYILNKCTGKELEAVSAAVEKRKKDRGRFSVDPTGFAKNISKAVNESISQGIAGMQESIKNMAFEMVHKESPELSEDECEKIVQMMIPDVFQKKHSSTSDYLANGKSLVDKNGKVNGCPANAMREMISAFINYSNGTLRPEEDRALQNALGDWQAVYWKTFPEAIQDLIRKYLKDGLPDEVFIQAIDLLIPETEE